MTTVTGRFTVVDEHVVRRALDSVVDPELAEPITDLGFVHSVHVGEETADGSVVEIHLRLPTSFCAPNFAYLMAADAQDVVADLPGVRHVVVELDDHHDSDRINAGLAAGAGYRGTFGHEADRDLDGLRLTFRRKAHTAAVERCLTALLRTRPGWEPGDLAEVTLGDLPDDRSAAALRRRRADLDLPDRPDALVLVDDTGSAVPPEDVEARLRRARLTRISIEGNAHFCRGLLRTRYPDSEHVVAPPSQPKESTS